MTIAGGAVAVALVTIGLAIYENAQQIKAVRQRELADSSLDFLINTFKIANPATHHHRDHHPRPRQAARGRRGAEGPARGARPPAQRDGGNLRQPGLGKEVGAKGHVLTARGGQLLVHA